MFEAERVESLYHVLNEVMTREVGTLELDLRRIDHADTKLLALLIIVAGVARKSKIRFVIHVAAYVRGLMQIYRLEGLLTQPSCFGEPRDVSDTHAGQAVARSQSRLCAVIELNGDFGEVQL